MTEILNCTDCKLHETSIATEAGYTSKVSGMLGKGSAMSDCMIIGEAPGSAEILRGEPFVGQAGQLVNDYMRQFNLRQAEFFITNVVKCRPPKNRTPSEAEIRKCSHHLKKEIEEIKPKLIILLGSVAMKAVLGFKKGIVSLTGKTFFNKDGIACIPIIHPAFLLRSNTKENKELFRKGWESVSKFISTSGKVTEKKKVKYQVCKTLDDVKRLEKKLHTVEKFSYDIETTGFDYLGDDKILCISFSWKERTAVLIPIHSCNPYYNKEKTVKPFWKSPIEFANVINTIKLILDSTVPKVAQHGKFDNKFLLTQYDIEVKNFKFDTMLAHALLNENSLHGLDSLVLEYTDMGDYWSGMDEYLKVKPASFAMIPNEILWEYACADADAEFRLSNIFYDRLKEEKLMVLYNKIVHPYSNVLMNMEINGLKVDTKVLELLTKSYCDDIQFLEKELYKLLSIKRAEELLTNIKREKLKGKKSKKPFEPVKFNSRSTDHKRALLYGDPKATGKTDVETLELFVGKNKACEYLVELSGLNKFYGTYLKNIPELLGKDDRLRTTFTQHVTVTGRLSSTKPNLQNQPKRGEHAKDIRSYFICDKNCYLVEADYKQAEFRLWGEYAQDERMIKDITNGLDIHTEMAGILYKKNIKDVTKDERTVAKQTVFSIIYGKSSYNLSLEHGISQKDAEETIEHFFKRYPRAKLWINEIKNSVIKNGYTSNYFGRKRRLPIAKEIKTFKDSFGRLNFWTRDSKEAEALRQAVNAPIQSFAHDCLSIAALRVDKRLEAERLATKILLDIHDALLFEVPKVELKNVCKIIKEEMERPIAGIRVPMRIDISYGTRWSEMKEVN